jgi:hypothetical protein
MRSRSAVRGHQLLQSSVFFLELFQLPNLIHLQPYVLLLPAVERLLANPSRRHTSATGTPTSACFKIPTICSTGKRFLFTPDLPCSGQILPDTHSPRVLENGEPIS